MIFMLPRVTVLCVFLLQCITNVANAQTTFSRTRLDFFDKTRIETFQPQKNISLFELDIPRSTTPNIEELRAKATLMEAIAKYKNTPNCPLCANVDGSTSGIVIGNKAEFTRFGGVSASTTIPQLCPEIAPYYDTRIGTCNSRSKILSLN